MLNGCSQDDFLKNEILKRPVCMTVINIGELVKGLSNESRLQYAKIPWKQIAGFRDIAAHKYAALNMKDVYTTVINDLPELKKDISDILSKI